MIVFIFLMKHLCHRIDERHIYRITVHQQFDSLTHSHSYTCMRMYVRTYIHGDTYTRTESVLTISLPQLHPFTSHSILLYPSSGNLHCLLALGEYVELEDSALALRNHLKNAEQVEEYSSWMAEVQKLGSIILFPFNLLNLTNDKW